MEPPETHRMRMEAKSVMISEFWDWNFSEELFQEIHFSSFDDIDDDKIEDDDASDINDLDGGAEEEPLNSEDDVTDEDNADLFETDNVVVCQYDKVRQLNRSREIKS